MADDVDALRIQSAKGLVPNDRTLRGASDHGQTLSTLLKELDHLLQVSCTLRYQLRGIPQLLDRPDELEHVRVNENEATDRQSAGMGVLCGKEHRHQQKPRIDRCNRDAVSCVLTIKSNPGAFTAAERNTYIALDPVCRLR